MNISRFSIILTAILCLLSLVSGAQAASIKDRMAERIPAINSLKDQGVIGENNKGYLEYRVAKKIEEKLVADENVDRSAVYHAIGKNQGASPELVGQRRAKMIVESGKSGHWFQKPDGTWFKK